jgi:hypothetical protein
MKKYAQRRITGWLKQLPGRGYVRAHVTDGYTSYVVDWRRTFERELVIPCMFCSGLMMAESRPKHVALM